MNIPFSITDKGVTVFVDGKPRGFARDHVSYDQIVAAIHANDEVRIRELVDVRGTVETSSLGRVKIGDSAIFVGGRQVHGRLIDRILEMVALGSEAVDGYVKFLDNLYDNPSKRAVDELWGFIEACNLPVTSDGHFLAYRFVDGNYMDSFSRTVCNKPASLMTDAEVDQFSVGVVGGARNEVTTQVIDGITHIFCDRNMVDEDKERTCSTGLHFCSYGYLPSYGGGARVRRVVVVKINPADVVAIPADHNNEKGRTCRYTVVSEIEDWDAMQITPFYTDEYDDDPDEYDDLDIEVDEDVLDIEEEDDDDLPPVEAYMAPAPAPTPVQTSGTPTLNEAQVANIKALNRDHPSLTMTAIGDAYGVHRETVSRILTNRTWHHVSPAAVATWPVRFNRGS